ncbi:putative MAM domain-containing protein 2-like [Penaeus vannamei]|uniref:Putative MAM domain-containing protein 2-like n=1 Tax=Penaeus vannamei TaxID=6689 RepID=A0A3R7QN99_PENVA|nr:putative MAM domain-containing protein 2-like [Penaeus vannamei]
MCVKFWYSIGGLSPDRLRVLLHPMPDDMTKDDMDEMMMGYDGSDDVVLWEARDMTMGDWKEGQVVYTFDQRHSNDLSRRFRGFIAIDELSFADSSECGAFCTFEGGICGWTQDSKDDFDWTQSRGSLNPSTGPPRDRSSFANNGMMGGYAFIDSSYPRRPGDKARLMSQEFQGTNPDSPLCMRFWTHMFGNGIGSLRVIIFDVNTDEDKVIWQISGEAGNAWYQGQVPIASPSPFKIVFEGVVGANNLGDIAIDDISIIQGACPSAPQVAAGNNGDCTFEVDECGWTNPGPRERADEIDWVRTVAADNRAPSRDHTIGTAQGRPMHLELLRECTRPAHAFIFTPLRSPHTTLTPLSLPLLSTHPCSISPPTCPSTPGRRRPSAHPFSRPRTRPHGTLHPPDPLSRPLVSPYVPLGFPALKTRPSPPTPHPPRNPPTPPCIFLKKKKKKSCSSLPSPSSSTPAHPRSHPHPSPPNPPTPPSPLIPSYIPLQTRPSPPIPTHPAHAFIHPPHPRPSPPTPSSIPLQTRHPAHAFIHPPIPAHPRPRLHPSPHPRPSRPRLHPSPPSPPIRRHAFPRPRPPGLTLVSRRRVRGPRELGARPQVLPSCSRTTTRFYMTLPRGLCSAGPGLVRVHHHQGIVGPHVHRLLVLHV